jgi:hypothetical protein
MAICHSMLILCLLKSSFIIKKTERKKEQRDREGERGQKEKSKEVKEENGGI